MTHNYDHGSLKVSRGSPKTTDTGSERLKTFVKNYLPGFLLIGITFFVYIPAMQAGFIWDDDFYVTDNETLKSIAGLLNIWINPGATPQYYPLVFTSFWVEHQLWGLSSLGYHLVNILFHALNTFLLWRLLLDLKIPGAWIAAAIFALHPVHVESVAWITERKNVLSAFFYLLSMSCLFRFFNLTGDNRLKQRFIWYGTALLLFMCALLSKTVTSSLPAALLLLIWFKRNRIRTEELAALLPFFALGLFMGLITVWLERHHVGASGMTWDLNFVERCLIAGRALWFYAWKLIWPSELIFNYPRWEIDATIWWQYAYPVGALLVIIALWAKRHQIGRGPLVAVLFFCGTLFPALGFFDVYPFLYSFVADHFQYLASIGLIVLAASVLTMISLKWLPSPNGFNRVLGTVLLLLLSWQTWQQQHIYTDAETLWIDTIEKNPRSWMAHNNLGGIVKKQGKFDEAIRYYSEALRIKPDYAKAHNNLGNTYASLGNLDAAIHYFNNAVRIKPDFVGAHYNLGNTYARQRKRDRAIHHYNQALKLRPDFAQAHNNLGLAMAEQGNLNQAVSHLLEAIRLIPQYAEAHANLSLTYWAQGKETLATRELEIVDELNPKLAAELEKKMTLSNRQ